MQPIPDTGPGLAGFLAHYLGRVYAHFPSAGHADWLLLFLLVAAAAYGVFLPYLWKSVQADMTALDEGSGQVPNQGCVAGVWGFVCLALAVWFFHTEAGRKTFLAAREAPLGGFVVETYRPLYWFSLFLVVLLLGLIALLDGKASSRYGNRRPRYSWPTPGRDFLSLYGGGGVFVTVQDGVPTVQSIFMSSIVLWQALVILAAHLVYWYWSAASLFLMHCFLLLAAVTDGVRVGFVYVLHKRTFG